MESLTTGHAVGKRILLATAAPSALSGIGIGATVDWNRTVNDVWVERFNWSTNNLPRITDTARISGGGTTAFTLELSDGKVTTVDWGTLLLTNTSYAELIAGAATAATLNFGSLAAVEFSSSQFYLGGASGQEGLILSVPGGGASPLDFRVTSGVTVDMSSNAQIVGAGSVAFSRLNSGTLEAGIQIGQGFSGTLDLSTYTGGTTVNPNVRLDVRYSSFQTGTGTIDRGPLGRGTVTLNGGMLVLGTKGASSTG